MITFYQWNKTFKTIDHNKFLPLSPDVQQLMTKNDDLLINGYQKQSRKTCKKRTIKQRTQKTAKQTLKIQQDPIVIQHEETPLKNLAIRERLNTLSPCKDSIMVRNSLIISKLQVKKCDMSFQKSLPNKVTKKDLTCSARRDSKTSQGKSRPMFSHRYSAHRSENKSDQKSSDKIKTANQAGPYNRHNKLKVLTEIIDKYRQNNPQMITRETLLSKFLKIQQKTDQKTVSYESIIRRKTSKTEDTQEEPLYLSPSRRKSCRQNEETNKWGRYRRSTSNYKTSTINQSNNHQHSLQSISIQWSPIGPTPI